MGKKLAETASNSCLSTAGFEQCIPLSTSTTRWGEMGLGRSCNKVEASIYAFGQTGSSADDLSHDEFPLIINNDMGTLQYHAAQLFGKSLIDHDIMPHLIQFLVFCQVPALLMSLHVLVLWPCLSVPKRMEFIRKQILQTMVLVKDYFQIQKGTSLNYHKIFLCRLQFKLKYFFIECRPNKNIGSRLQI